MMQFKGRHQERLFQQIEEAVNRLNRAGGYTIELTRADFTPPLSVASLEEHLKDFIASSDFIIAEISQINPNVLFEMGYAIGLRKPVVIMAQQGTAIPADFRGRLYFQYAEDDFELLPQMLQNFLRSAVDSCLAQQHQTRYYVETFSNRSVADLTQRLLKAENSVDILTTNLYSIVTANYPKILIERLKKHPSLEVRILTLDPESDFAASRAKQIGISIRSFREQLRESFRKVSEALSKYSEQCEIGVYDEFPNQIAFRIDRHVYINIVSANQQSRNNILFKLKETDAGVSGSILSHFDTLWQRSDKGPFDWG